MTARTKFDETQDFTIEALVRLNKSIVDGNTGVRNINFSDPKPIAPGIYKRTITIEIESYDIGYSTWIAGTLRELGKR